MPSELETIIENGIVLMDELEWAGISRNPSISIEFIEKHFNDYPWVISELCFNPNITPEFVLGHLRYFEEFIELEALSIHPKFGLDFFESTSETIHDWYYVNLEKCSRRIIFEFLEKHKNTHFEISFRELSTNQFLTEKIIDTFIDRPWDWKELSSHPNISMDFIRKHINKPWNFEKIVSNPNLTSDFIREFNLNVNFKVGAFSGISLEFIKTSGIDWWEREGACISHNPNLTIEFLRETLDKNWDWRALSMNPAFDCEIIDTNMDLPWDIWGITYNSKIKEWFIRKHLSKIAPFISNVSSYSEISLEFIESTLDLSWNWDWGIMLNPNLTKEFIEKHRDKITDIGMISHNPFCKTNARRKIKKAIMRHIITDKRRLRITQFLNAL